MHGVSSMHRHLQSCVGSGYPPWSTLDGPFLSLAQTGIRKTSLSPCKSSLSGTMQFSVCGDSNDCCDYSDSIVITVTVDRSDSGHYHYVTV